MGDFTPDLSANSPSFFATDGVSSVARYQLDGLVELAQSGNGISRYCLHNNHKDVLHAMIIAQTAQRYWRPKKHTTKDKVFHIVQGRMAVIEFHESGLPRNLTVMATDEVFAVRLVRGTYHTNFALSEVVVHHEIILGPYVEGELDRIEAPFAPSGTEQDVGKTYVINAMRSLGMDPNDHQ